MRQPVRILVGSLAAALFLAAMPAVAAATGDDDGGNGGAGGGGITWSVQDNGSSGDLISGALEPPVAPPPGTPLCGALPPEFPVDGNITVQDNTFSGGDRAFGSGNVPAFGGGVGAPFSFDASSGPLGQNPTGTFDLGFPTGRASSGRVTCLQVVGNIAYIGGERGSGDDDDGDDDDDDGDDDDDDGDDGGDDD